jgi:hypothetical protein
MYPCVPPEIKHWAWLYLQGLTVPEWSNMCLYLSENTRAPILTAVQHDQSTYEGNSVQLRCVVPPGTGRPPHISWKRDNQPLPANAVVRGEVLQLTNVQLSDQGRYICEARTNEGHASDYINLKVDRKYLHYHCLCGNLRVLKHTKPVTW